MMTFNIRSEKYGSYINKFYEILRLWGWGEREKKMWRNDINSKSTVVSSIREHTRQKEPVIRMLLSSYLYQASLYKCSDKLDLGYPPQNVGRAEQFNLGMGHWPKTLWGEEEATVFLIFVIRCSVHSQIYHLEYTTGIQAE